MPATASLSTPLDVSAHAYWSLRRDRNFDLWSAERDGATFELHSDTEDVDADGASFFIVESTVSYPRESIPGPMQGMLKKDEPFRAWSRFQFWRDKFDEAHLATFETRPSIFGDKLVISGDCWCEPSADGTGCVLHTRHEVTCKVFGVGSMIEGTVLGSIKTSYGGLNALTIEYMKTDGFKAFSSLDAGAPATNSEDALATASVQTPPQVPADGQSSSGSNAGVDDGGLLAEFSVSNDVRGSVALGAMESVVDQMRASLSNSDGLGSDGLVFDELMRGVASSSIVDTDAFGGSSGAKACRGYLFKRGEVNTSARRRYFVLDADGELAWFAKPPPAGVVLFGAESGRDVLMSLWAHGRVSVTGAHVEAVNPAGIESNAPPHDRTSGGGAFSFSLRLASAVRRPSIGAALSHLPGAGSGVPGAAAARILHLAAENESERQMWIRALSVHSSGAHGPGEVGDGDAHS